MNRDDEQEFREFFRARFDALRALAYLTCGDWQAAEDAVSRSLAKLYVRWHKIDSPLGYAQRMVVRAAIDEGRRPWRRETSVGGNLPDQVVADPAGNTDERLRLREALLQVPPRQRAVLVLRYYEGLSVEETATALRLATGTVKSQSARGLNTLRKALGVAEIRISANTLSREDSFELRPA
ncbi:SigE family RNA polymerase sigma factor [Plantactinospora soyae]|uniref:RNA polymerase sigma-70 factor (Sigma-E family) n=1 Tax=Plantactinospora soyae TaxID=1544732 RepID=A0A927M3J3_9ACTN|nr:SigE family RNA polymerase sigma factor [Plantactinospora soyae]MBE1487402.1 RNA polymerase sigma-70 factor (sigma-E family) [Plantactinospora soyae]